MIENDLLVDKYSSKHKNLSCSQTTCKDSLRPIKNVLYSPISGNEPSYIPEKWNSKNIIKNTTCYTYALDIMHKVKGRKLMPGEIANIHHCPRTAEEFVELVASDIKSLDRYFNPIEFNKKCPKGSYKIAIVLDHIDLFEGKIHIMDFHFYRQNPDKTWSHKFGLKEVTNLDASGKIIINPEQADRNYKPMRGSNYKLFVGYYALGENNK